MVAIQTIADDDILLRRIHPLQVVMDENTGRARPSSGAFKDPSMSVDSEQLLTAASLDHSFCLRNDPNHSLVSFRAEVARGLGMDVNHTPIVSNIAVEANPAHVDVVGKKSPGKANRLRDASTWVVLKT
jgi:hypothetical protein